MEVVRGSVDERSFVVACMLGRRIVGALGFDSPRAMLEMDAVVDAANPVVVAAPLTHAGLARHG